MTELVDRLRQASPAVLRIALALVFLAFGLWQLRDPASVVGWLPAEASMIPIPGATLGLLNGAFEVLFGALLVLGVYTRLSALLLGLHLAGITLTIGFTQVGIRDFGLAFATLAVALYGPDAYGVDARFASEKPQ